MTSLSLATLSGGVKRLYDDGKVYQTAFTDYPTLALLKKQEDFYGDNAFGFFVMHGRPQGRSADFATAQGNATALKGKQFLLTRVADYSVATVNGRSSRATKGKRNSFIDYMEEQIDQAMGSLSEAIETFLYKSGTGSIGRVSTSATVTNKTIALQNINDAVNFEVGMTLRGTSTDGGAYDTGEEVLAGVNRTTGEITATSAAWNTVMTSLAAGDYLVVDGDAQAGAALKKITGFEGWFPSTAPSAAESFFGVDRSTDSRLWGTYFDGSSKDTVENAWISALWEGSRVSNGKPKLGFCNPTDFRQHILEYSTYQRNVSYGRREAQGAKGRISEIGFESAVISGPRGQVDMISSYKCPQGKTFFIEEDVCFLKTLGKATQIIDEDGLTVQRQATADGFEVRLIFDGNFYSKAPSHCIHVTLP